MRRKTNKKLKWNKPYLSSFGNIIEISKGVCSLGSTPNPEDPSCTNGSVASNSCSIGGSILGGPS